MSSSRGRSSRGRVAVHSWLLHWYLQPSCSRHRGSETRDSRRRLRRWRRRLSLRRPNHCSHRARSGSTCRSRRAARRKPSCSGTTSPSVPEPPYAGRTRRRPPLRGWNRHRSRCRSSRRGSTCRLRPSPNQSSLAPSPVQPLPDPPPQPSPALIAATTTPAAAAPVVAAVRRRCGAGPGGAAEVSDRLRASRCGVGPSGVAGCESDGAGARVRRPRVADA